MAVDVKSEPSPDLRANRISRTEAAVVAAARDLFLSQGYVATTLAQVAEQAGVATRTVFVRFGTKAALFRRVIDRALDGEHEPAPVAQRPRMQEAMTAAALPDRIDAFVDVAAGIWQRAGGLFEVAAQAEGLEPEIAQAFRAGRRATANLATAFWRRAAADGLLPDQADVKLLGVTTDVLTSADTIVHLRRTRTWSPRDYRRWLTFCLRSLGSLD
jgi:AcrR family transcriptional regulator